MKKFVFHTSNLRRFPGFAVCCCNFFRRNPRIFHDFVSECVSFLKKINNQFWEVTVFSEEKCQFSLDAKQKTHFTDENERKKSQRSAPSNNICSFVIVNHSTTTTSCLPHRVAFPKCGIFANDGLQLLKAEQSSRVKRTLVRNGPRASHQSQGKIENGFSHRYA